MQEYHLLKVENETGSRTYNLNTSTIIIGQKNLSGINVDDESVRPHHAVLRRVPTIGSRESFLLIAGTGKVFTKENGAWAESNDPQKHLVTGDVFQLGSTRFSYMMAYMSEADYAQFFNAQPVVLETVKAQELALQS